MVRLLELAAHGPDTFVGTGPRYHWEGLYGGHIVAQSLRAAALTVDPEFEVHSLRAYFIRRGDHREPIRFEVDRIRNGSAFVTRRVVARQDNGAILNLEASFQRHEETPTRETVTMPTVHGPDGLVNEPWTHIFDRLPVPLEQVDGRPAAGSGRSLTWMRAAVPLGDDQLLHRCALAYMSDDMPTEAVARTFDFVPAPGTFDQHWFAASLDHSIWFHRPVHADQWHLYDVRCHAYSGGRGLTFGHVFASDGTHVATMAQEVLLRSRRPSSSV
jgi:acyl-CoA thioesterase-2